MRKRFDDSITSSSPVGGATMTPPPCSLRGNDDKAFGRFEDVMYQRVTRNIEVTVSPRFMPEKSSAEKGLYFWAYTVGIANRGPVTVQLKTRHWRITDGFGRIQEVRGTGVVGEEPVLEPGASYEYTSGVPLPTPSGIMMGSYGMVTTDGERFEIDIPAFSLDGPETRRTLN
jgi:ApaG protein